MQGMRASSSTAGEDNDRDRDMDEDHGTEDGASVGFKSPVSASAGLGGLSALSSMGNHRTDRESDDDMGGGRSESDYYDKSFGRTSVASDKPTRNGSRGGRTSNAGADDRLRRDYELKIATMQSKINGLEGDVAARKAESEDRVKALTRELDLLRSVSDCTRPRQI